jgi:2-dehydropantoate 2-reductase
MRVAILGTGALGCIFASRLAAVAEVWVLGTWAEAVQAIHDRGITIHEPDGSLLHTRVHGAETDPTRVPPCDAALLLVKSYQTARAAAWAATVLHPDGLAVSLQNGLDNEPKLVAAVGTRRAAVGVNYVGGISLGPGAARFIVSLTSYIGRPAQDNRRSTVLAALLTAAGLATEVVEDIAGPLWGKAVINAAINPLTALWRLPNGDLIVSENRRALLAKLVHEAAAVAAGIPVTLPYDDPVAATEQICRASTSNRSSMLQDVERGRPTEVDSINGVIVTEGRRLGVPTPYNEVVWQLIRALAC